MNTQQSANTISTLMQDNQTLMNRQILLQRDIDRVMRYLEQLQHDILLIEKSRTWRIGFKIINIIKIALGRPIDRHAFTNIHQILSVYHHWKKSRD